jgi:hypothetical protein
MGNEGWECDGKRGNTINVHPHAPQRMHIDCAKRTPSGDGGGEGVAVIGVDGWSWWGIGCCHGMFAMQCADCVSCGVVVFGVRFVSVEGC